MRCSLSFGHQYPDILTALCSGDIHHWNTWRKHHPTIIPNLSGVNLSRHYLFEADLTGAILTCADLSRACLIGANLARADLTDAVLTGAYIRETNLTGAVLTLAQLNSANLGEAIVTGMGGWESRGAGEQGRGGVGLRLTGRRYDEPFAIEGENQPRFSHSPVDSSHQKLGWQLSKRRLLKQRMTLEQQTRRGELLQGFDGEGAVLNVQFPEEVESIAAFISA